MSIVRPLAVVALLLPQAAVAQLPTPTPEPRGGLVAAGGLDGFAWADGGAWNANPAVQLGYQWPVGRRLALRLAGEYSLEQWGDIVIVDPVRTLRTDRDARKHLAAASLIGTYRLRTGAVRPYLVASVGLAHQRWRYEEGATVNERTGEAVATAAISDRGRWTGAALGAGFGVEATAGRSVLFAELRAVGFTGREARSFMRSGASPLLLGIRF